MGTANDSGRGRRAPRASLPDGKPPAVSREPVQAVSGAGAPAQLRLELERRVSGSEGADRAAALLELAALALRCGHLDEARRTAEAAAAAHDELGRPRDVAAARAHLGLACALLGDAPGSRLAFARAFGTSGGGAQLGEDDPELEARLLLLSADAAFAMEDAERARHSWERARAHFESYWDGAALARIYAGLAMIAAAELTPHVGSGKVLAGRALEEAEAIEDSLARGRACLAEALVTAGSDPHGAQAWALRATEIFETNGLERELAEACLRWGVATADDAAAMTWLRRAEQIFRGLGTVRDVERARLARRRRERGTWSQDRAEEVRRTVATLRSAPGPHGMNIPSAWQTVEQELSEMHAERHGWRLLADVLAGLATQHDRALLPLEIARYAARLVGADRAVVALVDGDGEPQLVGAARMPEEDPIWRRPVTSVVALGSGPALFRDAGVPGPAAGHDPVGGGLGGDAGFGATALACPMTYDGRALGAIYCDRVPSGGTLTERELELATLLAGVASTRLGASLLGAELVRSDRRRDALLDTAAEGLIIVDAHGRLEAWNRPAAMLLGLSSPHRLGSRDLAQPEAGTAPQAGHAASAESSAPAMIATWPELQGLAEPGADEVEAAVAVLPGGAARVRSRRLRGDVAEPAGVVLALHPMGEVSEGCVRLEDVVAVGPLMRRRLRTAEAATRGHGPVLVCGESGTGRRQLARAIAGATSARAAVLVDARALADGHGLFGTPQRPGLVEQIGPVPLVLLDADELEPEVSTRLLDALARRGAPRLFVTSRRPISDLTRHLPREARDRLVALSIELPPLRERPEELTALTEHLLERAAARLERALVPSASPEVLDALRAHSWPGNVAELERVLFDEVARAPADLDVLYEVPVAISAGAAPTAASGRSIADAERHLLIQALQQHRGNVPRVARTLGVSKGTVYNMMRKYRIDPASYRVSS